MINDIVIDTNIIFSSLLSSNSKFLNTILRNEYNFISPNYVIVEIFEKKERILKYSKLEKRELTELLNIILNRIHFISNDLVSFRSRKLAYDLCKNIDIKDVPFLALAIEFDCNLWTGDKKLFNGLINSGFNKFFIL